jgi:hypothetical protein
MLRWKQVLQVRIIAWFLAGMLAGPFVLAQQFGFTAFTPKDGLAQSQVRCMAQDSAGYMWFGTLGGASRFDGDFTNYGLRQGLPDPQVNAMLAMPDRLGVAGLWVFIDALRRRGHAHRSLAERHFGSPHFGPWPVIGMAGSM